MGKVYSFFGFSRALIANRIKFSIRDFLVPSKVDYLIGQLVERSCSSQTFIGAGIARSCFDGGAQTCVVKVDKNYYVDIDDDHAEWEYYDTIFDDDFVDGGWQLNDLKNAIKGKECYSCQNRDEVHTYEYFQKKKPELLSKIAIPYAVSSNYAVEVMEYCSHYDGEENAHEFLELFNDAHDGNLGYNSFGKLVLLDYGMEEYA